MALHRSKNETHEPGQLPDRIPYCGYRPRSKRVRLRLTREIFRPFKTVKTHKDVESELA